MKDAEDTTQNTAQESTRKANDEPVEEQIEFALGDYDFVEHKSVQTSVEASALLADIPSTAAIPAPVVQTVSDSATGQTSDEVLEMKAIVLPDAPIVASGDLMDTLEAIPQKMAFKIGEAAEMVGVKQYVLRYWETEFEMLRPRKSKNNQRVYSRRDVETAMMIKKLLYQDRFSIEGARTALRQLKSQVKEERSIKAIAQSQETAVSKLRSLVNDIRRIREVFA